MSAPNFCTPFGGSGTVFQKSPDLSRHLSKCEHGLKYLCPACSLRVEYVKDCPVPSIWTTNAHGKIFVYESAWKELKWLFHNAKVMGFSRSDMAKFTGVHERTLRYWKSGCLKPKTYTDDEFEFTRENLYWVGLCFSDGHLRRNGSENAYTWQVGSSDPFQGYWYPHFAQKHLSILRHKNRVSKTYLKFSETYSTWAFHTNVSGISPVFGKFLERKGVIFPRKTSLTTGFKKSLPKKLLTTKGSEVLFQGIFDGDGFYMINNNGIQMGLSFDYTQNNTHHIIEISPLAPTLLRNSMDETFAYNDYGGNDITEVRFAPSSLSRLEGEPAENVANQFEFMIEAAKHSIRPDKVHNLISIIERLASAGYGEYYHCLDIQKEIRNEIQRKRLLGKTEELRKRYPKKNGYFKPFRPKWADKFGSKNTWLGEVWDFFLSGENLECGNYTSKENLDFSRGVPVNFTL